MKYENGRDIFPEHLLKQIQKYVSGKLVYIPAGEIGAKPLGINSISLKEIMKSKRNSMQEVALKP